VLGRGCEAGLYYLVMELLHGKSLASVLTESPHLPEGRAARLVIQLCGALDVAHGRGVVHRDIKPDNIMLIDGGDQVGERVKLLDFGIAKRIVEADQRVEDSFSSGADTRYGALLGTPEYMAPEQCMGRDVDRRTDVYACGVLLYRMVTGQVPFDGTNAHPFELCQRHIGEDPAPPRALAPWIRPDMEAIILKALAKAPDARQQSAAELRDELIRLLAAIEAIEVEPTQRLLVEDLVRAGDAARIEAELAAQVTIVEAPSAGLPLLMPDDEPASDRDPVIVAIPIIPAEIPELRAPPGWPSSSRIGTRPSPPRAVAAGAPAPPTFRPSRSRRWSAPGWAPSSPSSPRSSSPERLPGSPTSRPQRLHEALQRGHGQPDLAPELEDGGAHGQVLIVELVPEVLLGEAERLGQEAVREGDRGLEGVGADEAGEEVRPGGDLPELLPQGVRLVGGVDDGGEEILVGEDPLDAAAGVDGGHQREERGGGGGVERPHVALAVGG
jgi:serine/threonine protein kinase